jgi:C1A family cysteine protease
MKYLNQKKFKTIFIILSFTFVLFSSLNVATPSRMSSENELNSTNEDIINNKYSDHTFIYSLNGKRYLAEYITREKVEEMKMHLASEETKRNYNEIIDGHGTGYSTPTEEDLETLIGKISLLELSSGSNQKYRASTDISTEIYFPSVGNQGMQGSCSAWANAYYAYGYLEAKDYDWDASSGNPDYLLSPAWAYNIIAAYDYGSIPYEVAQVLVDWGVPTLSAMPYNDMDFDSWGDEVAWRQAPYHRPIDYSLITYIGPATIDIIKSLIDTGTPVTIGIDANQFSNGLDQVTMDFILSSDEYDSDSLNHAQCFVGYDDTITEGSDVGAFRVVNSWGESWMDGGYYWLTYDAFAEFAGLGGQVIMFITDRIDYNPDLIATWEFSPAPIRMGDIVTLGVGPHGSPLDFTTPHYDYDINNVFPDFMALDISDFYSYYVSNNDVFFYLEIGPSDTTGTIFSFKLERYSGGSLVEISKESPDTPEDTPAYVNATFMIFTHELKTYLKVPINPAIHNSYQVEAIIINDGASDETSVDFDLFLNNVPVHSITIPNLPSGANITINYLWTPIEYDVYNFTAYITPVPGETYLSNNQYTEILYILGPIFYDDFESGLSKWVSITGLWHLTNTSSIWPDPVHSPTHAMWFGNESTGNYETGFQEVGDLISTTINLTDVDIAFLEFYHWREGEGGSYDVSSVYISIDGLNWDLIYETDEIYIPPWEKVFVDISSYVGNPSVQLWFNFDTFDSVYNDYRGWLVDDVAVLGTGVNIPHNLRVSLEVPESPELFNTYSVNATVTNIGTSSESDVYLYLYLDGVSVYSAYYPSFPIFSSQGFSYMWTPTYYGDYNFTAYAIPVPGEEFIYDNIATEIVRLHEIILFDGMFLSYSFEIFGESFTWESLYSYLSEDIFHNRYSMYYGGSLYDMGYWDVDTQTRLMINSYGGFSFGSGVHTPMWIFTEFSIGDLIPIAIDDEGDHIFNITGDSLYDLPGFDTVEVWELEDLTLPGGIACYEKSTGILLNGTFLYYGGLYNYTINIIDNNIFPTITVISPDSSSSWETGSSHYIYWTSTGAISDVKIELYKDGVFELEIEASTANNGDYYWTIPSELDDSTQYQIKISDASNPSIYDFSDYFEIKSPVSGKEVIPGYTLYLLIGIICVVSVLLIKNRNKKP